ncbi:MAG: dipeptidyl-peptidase 7 [Ponticaulis sp.]|nr:dipeptidyl-peptidase 7 [Ponticaulis sp.]|tara:strand:+ start:24351 stop:26522 length:2172 start_codon:yes stop_codon:yes gene_type:complete
MKQFLLAATAGLAFCAQAHAVEGMFTPDQLPEIAEDLKAKGLELDPAGLTDLTEFPMGAVVSLGGCTASFVSPEGLVVSNHHCVRGSIQINSTEENNYLKEGFLAADKSGELPAAPGTRVYVTTEVTDVSERVVKSVPAGASPRERYDAIDAARKAFVAECEEDPGYRCQVSEFFGGLEYKLIKQLEIRDVRLVYAPGDNIGKYGGDIDNWMWPRHTGDWGFYRAYVGPDGMPADYSEENVPYEPEHLLSVSSAGLDDGDFVMVAGYPGSTSRYERLAEVEYVFDWYYPTWIEVNQAEVDTILAAAPEGSDARIKYESRLASRNNYIKNRGGQIEGARRVGLKKLRAEREAGLLGWTTEETYRARYAESIAKLDELTEASNARGKREFFYNYATNPALLDAAYDLYRLANEKEKPDAERESGYQERDMTFFRQRLERIDRRYDPAVDMAIWQRMLQFYMDQPLSQRVKALDMALELGAEYDADEISAKLAPYYEGGVVADPEARIALMDASIEELEALDDPWMELAVALYDTEMEMEAADKRESGLMKELKPDYMYAMRQFQKSQGKVTYPDANSTLRVTYGSVMGGWPKDGLYYAPFTTLEGITEKDTGIEPFDAPQEQLDLINARDYGDYALESLGTVPVNFLTDLDSTGGNSGSATLNAQGELVGLLFDGTIESVNADWHFDPKTTRSIHVDTRYMLWTMEKVSGAGYLIDEMTIVGNED